MSAEGHKAAMSEPLCCNHNCNEGRACPLNDGYWPREQADTPLYTVEDMTALEWWAVVAVCVLALLAAASPIFWSAL